MDIRYGVAINNRYAMFDDDDDSLEDPQLLIKKEVVGKKGSADSKEGKNRAGQNIDAKNNKNASNTHSNKTVQERNNNNNNKNREDKENRNNKTDGKRSMDTRKPQEAPRHNRTENFNDGERKNKRNEFDNDGNRPRGGGRGRGGRGFGGRGGERGGGRGGRREFERKSGDERTGIKSVDKREGGGSHNWGTFEDEMKAEEDKNNISTDDSGTVDHNETLNDKDHDVTKNGHADDAEKEAEPEEPKTLTLDEWKAQQSKKDAPKFNERKAGEGSDMDPKWKKTYAYKKEKETQEDDNDEEHELYPQRVNRQRRLLDIEINFPDANRGGRGEGRGGRGGRGRDSRGGRGGDRGDRRGGGGDRRSGKPMGRGPRGRGSEAPNVNDERSFPSLG